MTSFDRIATLTVGHDIPTGGSWDPAVVRTYILGAMQRHGIDGGTILEGTGVWQGDTETCTVLQVWCTGADMDRIMAAGQDIRSTLRQDAVGLTVTSATVQLL